MEKAMALGGFVFWFWFAFFSPCLVYAYDLMTSRPITASVCSSQLFLMKEPSKRKGKPDEESLRDSVASTRRGIVVREASLRQRH